MHLQNRAPEERNVCRTRGTNRIRAPEERYVCRTRGTHEFELHRSGMFVEPDASTRSSSGGAAITAIGAAPLELSSFFSTTATNISLLWSLDLFSPTIARNISPSVAPVLTRHNCYKISPSVAPVLTRQQLLQTFRSSVAQILSRHLLQTFRSSGALFVPPTTATNISLLCSSVLVRR